MGHSQSDPLTEKPNDQVYELAPGKPACKECANSGTESKSAGPCKACSKPINGPHVKAWGFNWHNVR